MSRQRIRSSWRAHPIVFILVAGIVAFVAPAARAATTPGSLTFSNTPLLRPDGTSEPAISIAQNGTMALTGLQWNFNSSSFGTNLWTGPFGSTPTFKGLLDNQLLQPGKTVFGSGDADVDLGSTGTLHATTLLFFLNPNFKTTQLGVSAITCPHATSPTFSVSGCTRQIIDTAGADRPWITSDGPHVYISYHDSGRSSLVHMQRSDDDGFTWHRVGDPIVGQGGTTGDATFNNIQGRLMADPVTHNVYTVYAAGVTGVLKARTFTPNQVFVSRSSDMGKTWTANLVFADPPGSSFANIFPTVTVDPTNGNLYSAFSDGHTVWFSTSHDQASHWSPPVAVNIAPASTAIFPAIAAYNGTVDVTYYATPDPNRLDPSAVWNTYMAQTTDSGAGFTQSLVGSHSNHVGPVCVNGAACAAGTRNLLDLFEVAINPKNGRAAIIYTDDTLATTPAPNSSCLPTQTTTCPLPQIVLAQQN
jgi:hypothetical protein